MKNGSISFSELVTHFLLNRLLKDRIECVCCRHNKIEITKQYFLVCSSFFECKTPQTLFLEKKQF